MSDLLAGKRALVTAAAGTGIGFATALRLAEEGARVVLSDKHEKRLAEYAAQLQERTGGLAAAIPCDVTRQADVDRLFAEAGALDVVVANAGLGGTATILDMTDDEWHAVLDVTLTGTFRTVRAAMRQMIPRGGGSIVTLSSILGWRAQAGQAHYAAAKGGVMALTRVAAAEGAPHNVRVNSVAPSLAMHPNLEKVMPKETLEGLVKLELFGRAADPAEVANVIVFLASDLSSYMTGEVVSVSSQHP